MILKKGKLMWIQRTLHLAMPWQTAKARLLSTQEYRHLCPGLTEVSTDSASGETTLHLHLPGGLHARFGFRVTSETGTRLTLRSQSGDVEVIGMVEFFETAPKETEVVLTFNYRFASLPTRIWAFLCNSGERFLDQNLHRLEEHLQREPSAIRADRQLAKPINGQTPKPAME